jgi:HEAT repeat protein
MQRAEEEEGPQQSAAEPSPVDDLIEELIERGEEPFTPEQLALCRAHREEAIPALIDLATDEDLQLEGSPGDGYAPIRAVQLLGELRAAEATSALIDIVADSDPMVIIYSAAIHALENIGPPALELLLDFLRYSWDVATKTALAGAVAEAGQDDERSYKAMVELWEESTWEEGKSLVAYPLARIGAERAIPWLESALADPDLDWMDYNEVASALEALGVEVPPAPADSLPLDVDIGALIQSVLLDISEPDHLMAFADTAPEEWRSNPDGLAHAYTHIEEARLNNVLATQAISLPLEISAPLTADLLETVETLTFDASTREYPRWLRRIYAHLAECAGPDLQLRLTGVLLSLGHYLSDDYDIADDPDQLLAAARELPPDDNAPDPRLGGQELRRLFGQVGALALHGRPFWPLWPVETDRPLSDWLEGLIEFRRPLERVGQIPLRPSLEVHLEELSNMLMEALAEEEAPPRVAELLDLLIAQERDFLSPAQRRRFTHQRAAVMPHLMRVVEDRRYWHRDGPGGGWAAVLAVRLLGELKAAQAADALVSAVADSTPEDVIHDAALSSLMAVGRLALPAVQAYLRYGRAVETKTSLAEVLGRIGRRSRDTLNLLRQVWETAEWTQNRRMVALAFGDLRDRRVIPLLQAALEDRSADALDLDYVHWALRRLGAPAPPPTTRRSRRLKTPAPHNPRLIYDESDTPQRLKYTAWGKPLCPDCGQPLVQDENDEWIHSSEPPAGRPATRNQRKRKRKRRR